MVAPIRFSTAFAALLWAGLVFAMLPPPVAGQASPPQVTTDTPQYCLQLLDRVSELVRVSNGPLPEEISSLSSEGQRMCDQGQTRGGIMRLRRALVLLRDRAER